MLDRMQIVLQTAANVARRVGLGVLDVLLPPRCLACDAAVDRPGNLCAQCFSRFAFITRPYCQVCCLPFETAVAEDDLICGACMKDRPAFNTSRAVFVYRDTGRDLVLKLKHADRTDAASHLAQWLQRAGADVLPKADCIVPVPLHWRRLWLRTYNQAALLANALGRAAHIDVIPDGLWRIRATPSQGGLDRGQRRRNVAGAFKANPNAKFKGRSVLLIDDVMTTSATADSCARALLRADAKQVDVLVLARVPAPGS
jgi:ComF family protein